MRAKASRGESLSTQSPKVRRKAPDIERALSNWAKQQLAAGLDLTDRMIMTQLKNFMIVLDDCEQELKAEWDVILQAYELEHGSLSCEVGGPLAGDRYGS